MTGSSMHLSVSMAQHNNSGARNLAVTKKSRIYMNDPDGTRLPIKIDTTSNGEFMPRPLSATNIKANKMALENCDINARRTGQHRRNFLVSTAGAATTLLAINEANAATLKFPSSTSGCISILW